MRLIIAVFRLLFLGGVCSCGNVAMGQVISGQLQEEGSGEAISYASVRLTGLGIGTLSNQAGQFSIQLPDSVSLTSVQLDIQAFGYAPFRRTISLPSPPLNIQLPIQAFTLDAVVIYSTDLTAEEMVRQALQNRKDNYPTEPYVLRCFYRHYCQEQGVAGRLIEAAIDLYDEKGYDRRAKSPGKKWGVQLKQLRRSLDFTQISPYSHLPIALFSTLEHDLVAYRAPVLTDIHRETFQYRFQDTTYHNGTVIYVVRATGRIGRQEYSCDLYISTDDFAILRIEEQAIWGFRNSQRSFTQVDHFVSTYQQEAGKYYLSHQLNEGHRTIRYRDSLGQVTRTEDHIHHVELMVNAVQTRDVQPFYGGEPTREKMTAMAYDPDFWRSFTVLEATPLEQGIEADLEARVSLEKQYANFNHPERMAAIQEQLTEDKLAKSLQSYAGEMVLLCFWDDDYVPGVKELLFARKLAKTLEDKEVRGGLIFLSLEASEQGWQESLDRKRIRYVGQHLRLGKGPQSSIAQRYGVNQSPYFVLIGTEGEIVLQGSELPKRSEIEELLE